MPPLLPRPPSLPRPSRPNVEAINVNAPPCPPTLPPASPLSGQVVQVKVIDLDASKCRLGLSVRQTQPDPIRVTLDTVRWGSSAPMPAEMQQLMERLKAQPGVEDVHIGRQATEDKIASQVSAVQRHALDTGGSVHVGRRRKGGGAACKAI